MPEATCPERWEVGSEFHWSDDLLVDEGCEMPQGLPEHATAYASGAGALVSLLRSIGCRVVHLPSFFCIDVAEVLVYDVEVRWYRELPDGQGPRLDTLAARAGDAVLAVNLFGRGSAAPWQCWMRDHPDVTVIEDHTHDPVSRWARTSASHYAVASLRKTLPLPDGALVWSGRGLPLPSVAGGENPGAEPKLEAMRLKSRWLRGETLSKERFRALQIEGERAITGCATAPCAFTRAVLPRLDIQRLRTRRAANARVLVEALDELRTLPGPRPWIPVADGAIDAVPFHVQLISSTRDERDALLRHLVERDVFAAVHWPQTRDALWSGDDAALALGELMLTVPVDHRYDAGDMTHVAEILLRSGDRAQFSGAR